MTACVATLAQPADVTRVLRLFDFEERRLGNPEELPMHWLKVEGPGYPHYVSGRLATDRARSGKYSFRFDLNGGSLAYRYESRQIHVQVGAHYQVEGWCQTTVLAHARARMTAYFTDIDGHPLPGEHHSELYAASAPEETWKRLSIELTAENPQSACLVLELDLLQPAQFAQTSLGERALFNQDIHGSAWFDDIRVSQVPEVFLSTDRPGNVFRRGDALRLHVAVNDRFTEDLAAQLVITDADKRTIYQRSGALDMTVAEVIGPGQKRMSIDLPDLSPGWYQAALVMSSQGQFLGAQNLDLIRLADEGERVVVDSRFGLIATDLPFDGWGELPQVLPFLSVGRVKLALWSAAGDVQQMDPAAFDQLLERLGAMGVTPTGCLVDLPPTVAAKVGGNNWERLLRAPPEEWRPQLDYLIARHGNHLDRWQLGADGSDLFVTQPKMQQVYKRVYQEFTSLMQKPDLAMPWPAWYDLEGDLPATVALSVPPSVLPSQLSLYTQDIRGREGHNLSLSLELLDRSQYGREVQIRDLAQRFIYALACDMQRIDVPLPLSVRRENTQLVKQPQELFMILRTLTTTLAGAVYRGRVPLADGVEAFLFDRGGRGVLALWDRGNAPGVKRLAVNLGPSPASVDLWGNVTPLLRDPNSKNDVQLVVGPTPIFLVDIDGPQAELRASLAIDQPLLESSFEPHARHIRFNNPYRTAIAGMLRLKAPPGWTVNPPTFNFSLNPGETFDREITIEFPYNSFAGQKTVSCEFALQGESNSSFSVPLTLNLGLSDVGMQTLALRDGDNVIVQQMISNYGEKPINYSAFAVFPGQARQERLVTNLAAGRTTMKRYRFTHVPPAGKVNIRVGVKELDGMRILNDEIPIQ